MTRVEDINTNTPMQPKSKPDAESKSVSKSETDSKPKLKTKNLTEEDIINIYKHTLDKSTEMHRFKIGAAVVLIGMLLYFSSKADL